MYALLVQQIEQQVTAERIVAATLIAAGAKDVRLPTVEDARRNLDAALEAAPTVVDPEQAELRRALGVGT